MDGKGYHDDDGDDVTYAPSAQYEPLRQTCRDDLMKFLMFLIKGMKIVMFSLVDVVDVRKKSRMQRKSGNKQLIEESDDSREVGKVRAESALVITHSLFNSWKR